MVGSLASDSIKCKAAQPKRKASVPVISLFAAILNGSLFSRPSADDSGREASYAIAAKEDSRLRRAIDAGIRSNPGLSGFRIIAHGQEALMTRVALIDAAERTVDLQYYSIQNDTSGKLLLSSLLNAAGRGVRVRILIDDITINKSDRVWPLIDSHPNISMRLFNPLSTVKQGILGLVVGLFTRLPQFARRMHNKVFIVDNQVSIIGGRNLGDAYFDNSKEFNFRDIDIMAAGTITSDISRSFDSFWNSREAFPLNDITTRPCHDASIGRFKKFKGECAAQMAKEEFPLPPPIVEQLMRNEPPLIWAKAELMADSPLKVEKPREKTVSKPMNKLAALAAQAKREVIMVSPYFVPGNDGVAWLKGMVGRGVYVRVLTNSLASTDVIAVHTGYRRYREALIKDGIELYELKAVAGKKVRTGRFSSSSRASLHNKIYVVDRKDILVGTMNLDPRSVELNTEIALAIHDVKLATMIAAMFEQAIVPASSYRVSEPVIGGGMDWATEEKGREVHYKSDPDAGFWRRLKAVAYTLLPFENQL